MCGKGHCLAEILIVDKDGTEQKGVCRLWGPETEVNLETYEWFQQHNITKTCKTLHWYPVCQTPRCYSVVECTQWKSQCLCWRREGNEMFDRIWKHPLPIESLVCIGIGRKPKAESISTLCLWRHSRVKAFNWLITLRNRSLYHTAPSGCGNL